MAYKKPLPKPNPDTQTFWDGCKEHQLKFQKCWNCHHVRWPPSVICPVCYSNDTEWIVASGKGKVYTYCIYHQAFHPDFKKDLPYVVAIVELDEGPHLITNIVGCEPGEVRCEMPVKVVWDNGNTGFSLPKFKPVR